MVDDNLVKKIHLEKGPTFKKKAHVTSALKQTPPAVENA